MTTTNTATVSMNEVEKAIRDAMTNADEKGNGWHYVRVYPSGGVVVGEEVSRCVPLSEYFREEPHPVTVWGTNANYSTQPSDGCREWVACEDADADYWSVECPGGTVYGVDYTDNRGEHPHCTQPFKLGDWIDLDLSETLDGIREELEGCEWLEIVD